MAGGSTCIRLFVATTHRRSIAFQNETEGTARGAPFKTQFNFSANLRQPPDNAI
jgi:hypothetical protein